MARVRGNMDIVHEWEFNIDTIYHRTNVERVTDRYGHEMWEYDEERFNSMEFAEYLNNRDKAQKEALKEQNEIIIDNAYRVAMLEFNSTI